MAVDSENWDKLQALFHLASVTPDADRDRVMSEACPDPELRALAIAILAAGEVEVDDEKELEPIVLGGKIGPYSLLRLLGSGGIGSVYLAERMAAGTMLRSALKVLAPHAAGPLFVERFHREQKILASLDHPNITRMLDAGITEADQPYLVMEYVEGTHLDAYCDDHRLGLRDRLELFLHICDAVGYAHRNLVVHLDLKPSNILVTADGTVKLLDFGTSKLIQSDSLSTSTVMATPAYASPEQLRNEALTTACDVYSMGVILFELLSGRRPGGKASVAVMMERAITEREPEKLTLVITMEAAELRGLTESRLRQALRGDLATIVAKCLSPRVKDRYSTLDALAGDLQRYLHGHPVLARPQTTLYLVGKFVRRRKKAVVAALVFIAAILASLAYAGWRQEQAVLEGQRALRMQTFMYRLFKLANSSYTGKPTFTVPEFLGLGVKLLPDYIKNPADLREAQMSLAESMYEVGDLDNAQRVFQQIIVSAGAAGDVGAEAESEAFSGDIAYQKGQMNTGQTLTAHALELSKKPGVSPTVRVWSEIYYAANREKNGFRSDDNVRLLEAAVKEARDRKLPERETAFAIQQLADDFEVRGKLDEAEQLIKQDIAIYDNEPYAICDQSQMYEDLAFISVSRGDIKSSLPLYKKAYEGLKECSGPDKKNTLMVQALLAGAMVRLGQSKAVVPILESSLPAWKKASGGTPDMFPPLYYLSRGYVDTGRYAEGATTAAELLSCLEGKVAATDRRIGTTQMIWAKALSGEHRYKEALPHAEIAAKLTANGSTPYTQQVGAEARQVLADIQSKTK